ncbi:amino acid ABC transporter permease [Granulicatella sp. 20925_1_28]|jgi:amino ABC transporter, permease protein, 3-TM region, his/glu/gln/arg/opine family|uniref:amino acid ABC transporter permease n=1 Tax=Granulicatella sp. 20925_1_28 TaxID=3003686 RepID=UPI001CAD4CA1|nr:amino acid ABC transporter permease [Streptococcus sp.]MBF1725373.1 amino acid ABC transporter permease [Streptococcus sp.]
MELIIKYWPLFLEGATTTVLLSFFSVIVGVGCGTLMALARLSQNKFLSKAAKVYIDIIRGTPLLVQLYLVYFGLATVLDLNDFVSGVIAVSVNTTAYIAEIIRSGIQSVDKGQMEAARSMGMPKRMAMRQIILPQAMKNILPAIGNEFATLIKETSIVSLIGIHDLMYSSDTVRGATFTVFIPLLMTAFLYFVMTTTIAFFMDKLERKLQASD